MDMPRGYRTEYKYKRIYYHSIGGRLVSEGSDAIYTCPIFQENGKRHILVSFLCSLFVSVLFRC